MGRKLQTLLAAAVFFALIPTTPAGAAACAPVTLADLAPVTLPETATAPVEEQTPGSEAAAPPISVPSEESLEPPAVEPPPEEAPPPPPPPQPSCRPFVYKMLWPVLGGGTVGSTFGAERDGGARMHAGVDIFGPKMSPVVAVRDGVVIRLHTGSGDCCSVAIRHHDGWSSWYIHLNNDSYGTDDNAGFGVRRDLFEGKEVRAGEVIGWFGDSGNAEPGTPHLHFELRLPGGTAIDPLPSLRAGLRRGQPSLPDPSLRFDGPFFDDDGHQFEFFFTLLASLGAELACDDWGAAVCPDQPATMADVEGWIGALTRLQPPPWPEEQSMAEATHPGFNPTEVSADPTPLPIDTVCFAEPCPTPATLGEAISVLAWSVDQRIYQVMVSGLLASSPEMDLSLLPAPPHNPWEIDSLAAHTQLALRGMVDVCPLLTQPFHAPLTRSELARVVARAFGYLAPFPCNIL